MINLTTSVGLSCPIPNWSRAISHPEYIIRQPYIDTARHMGAIINLYDSFSAAYNNMVSDAKVNNESDKQPLRAAHRALFIDLVHLAKGQMSRNIYVFRDARSLLTMSAMEPYSLHTNRRELAERSKKSEISIYRQLMRLIDAGIIVKKIGHGTQRNFELLINPLIMPVSDLENEHFDPIKAIINFTDLCGFPSTLRSKCTPYRYKQEHFNNTEIPVNKPEQKKESATPINNNEHIENTYGNTGRTAEGTASEINDFHTGKNYAEKMRMQEERAITRTKRFSVILVEYMLRVLFSTHNIYPAERKNAYGVAEYYFRELHTEQQCAVAMEHYRQRIDMAGRYLDNHPEFSFKNIYPSAYLNPQNTRCGFDTTRKWVKQQEKYRAMKREAKALRTEQSIFDNAITRWHQSHTLENYMKISSYVKTRIPSRIVDFNAAVACVKLKKKEEKRYLT